MIKAALVVTPMPGLASWAQQPYNASLLAGMCFEAEAAQHAAWSAFPYAGFVPSVPYGVLCAATHESVACHRGGLTQAREAGADVVLLKREALDAAREMPGGAEAMLERLRYALSGDD